MKICTRCHEKKLNGDFPKHPLGRGGRDAQCKQCKNERRRTAKTDIDFIDQFWDSQFLPPHVRHSYPYAALAQW